MTHPREFKSLRPKLRSNKPLFGWYVTFQIPDIVEMIGGSWDWLWIDLQHSPINMDATLNIIRAAEAAGTCPLVRVGKNDSYLIATALDLGASGVIVPMVNTVEEAEHVVSAAKFPPAGRRSYGSRRLFGLYGSDYADHADEETVLFVQLESAQALENAEAARSTEPGCQQFDVIVDPEDLNRIAFYEVYDGKKALEKHRQTTHFKKYFEKAVPLLASRDLTIYNRIAP